MTDRYPKTGRLRAALSGAVRRAVRDAADDLFRRLESLLYPGSDGNGITIHEMFRLRAGTGITFDDFNLVPTFVGDPPGPDIDIRMPFGPHFGIVPIIGSPMDRVTEWLMAVQLALNGAIGFLHVNLPPEELIRQVRQVKRFQQGFIWEPLCLKPTDTVADAWRVKREEGFSTIPITEDGTRHSKFVGLVTKYCVDMEDDPNRPLGEVMIEVKHLRTFGLDEVRDLDEARRILHSDPRITKLPILADDGSIWALINRGNLAKSDKYPSPLMDGNHRLRVGAAVTTFPRDDEVVKMLLDSGVDAILVDASQGGSSYMTRRIRQIRRLHPDITIVAGNVVTPIQMMPLVEAGADVIRVGMGPGSICTTQGAIGIGSAQGTAVYYCARGYPGPIISDGGIRGPGDMIKSFALGASLVMVGRHIAGADESPAPEMEHGGRHYKLYRGMGSTGAQRDGMQRRGDSRYGESENEEIVAQGVDDQPIPAIGSLDRHLRQTIAGIRKGLQTLGCRSVHELHSKVADGTIRFQLRSEAAKTEGKPHDLMTLPVKN